jgi:hypothetical protein
VSDSTIGNVDVDPTGLYIYYNVPQLPLSATEINISGDVITNVTTINGGGGGRATGPSVTFAGSDGADFVASQTTITWVISNPTTMRTALSAAKSGVNSDITQFTALTGSSGWSIWTGTPDKTSHATYSGTASIGYVQAELQAVMDKLQQVTEAFKALQDTLLAGGEIKP